MDPSPVARSNAALAGRYTPERELERGVVRDPDLGAALSMGVSRAFARAAASVALLAFQAAAQGAPWAAHLGFAPDRLTRIDSFMQAAVDSNRIAGAVVLVMRDGQVVYERAFGWADREAERRMTSDAIFRIASQSKAITSAAVLSLVEEGRLAVSDEEV